MPRREELPRTEIKQFGGLVTHEDPTDLPPGTSPDMLNTGCARPGALDIRDGYRAITFEE